MLVREQKAPIRGSQFVEELKNCRSKEISIEFEHVKAYRTEKDRQQMSLFEKFTTEGNEKAMSKQRKDRCWMEDSWRR